MPSITTWTRLEPRTRFPDIAPGLRASLDDGLWLLGRQWQLGAFRAEDAATPIGVALSARATLLSRYFPGAPEDAGEAGVEYNGRVFPLEALVEREAASRADLRLAARAGMRFVDLLTEAGLGYGAAFTREYALVLPAAGTPIDAASARFLAVMSGRVPDGYKLRDALQSGGAVVTPSRPPIDQDDETNLHEVAVAWFKWWDGLEMAPADEPPWVRDRLEYCATLAAPAPATSGDEIVTVARDYNGDHLDWYSFDVVSEASLGAAADGGAEEIESLTLPTPVTYGGMPTPRWFELEDANLNLGSVEAGPPDLARLLLIEFASLYGNDHFVVPLTLPVGALCSIESLVVTDNFGGRTRVLPAGEASVGGSPSRMFQLTVEGTDETAELLFLPPTLGHSLVGPPLEEVRFIRDEMANLTWAIERRVEGSFGQPLDRYEAFQRQRRQQEFAEGEPLSPSVASAAAPRTWELQSGVPPHWFPLMPVRAGDRLNRLQLRELLDDAGARVAPQGRLLTEQSPPVLELFDEEVPRAGVQVRRRWQLARWLDGSTHLWLGRQKSTGRGEGSSGLRYDSADPSAR